MDTVVSDDQISVPLPLDIKMALSAAEADPSKNIAHEISKIHFCDLMKVRDLDDGRVQNGGFGRLQFSVSLRRYQSVAVEMHTHSKLFVSHDSLTLILLTRLLYLVGCV